MVQEFCEKEGVGRIIEERIIKSGRNPAIVFLEIKNINLFYIKKRVSYLYRTAQLYTLASFQTWGSSTGAGRIRLTPGKFTNNR